MRIDLTKVYFFFINLNLCLLYNVLTFIYELYLASIADFY